MGSLDHGVSGLLAGIGEADEMRRRPYSGSNGATRCGELDLERPLSQGRSGSACPRPACPTAFVVP